MIGGTDRDVLLVVVGAGASADCATPRRSPLRMVNPIAESTHYGRTFEEIIPPVTAELAQPRQFFNTILERYPAAANVVGYLRDALREDPTGPADTLENALARYEARGRRNP